MKIMFLPKLIWDNWRNKEWFNFQMKVRHMRKWRQSKKDLLGICIEYVEERWNSIDSVRWALARGLPPKLSQRVALTFSRRASFSSPVIM